LQTFVGVVAAREWRSVQSKSEGQQLMNEIERKRERGNKQTDKTRQQLEIRNKAQAIAVVVEGPHEPQN
jgi:hypothetical protein